MTGRSRRPFIKVHPKESIKLTREWSARHLLLTRRMMTPLSVARLLDIDVETVEAIAREIRVERKPAQ